MKQVFLRGLIWGMSCLSVAPIVYSPHVFAASQGVTSRNKSSASVGTSALTLMAANANRHFLFIQNISDVSIWINFSGTAAVDTAGSFELTPGSTLTYEGNSVPSDAVSVIAESGTGNKITAYEG